MLETRFLTDCGDIQCGIKIGCSPLFVLFRPSGPHHCYELYIYIYIYIHIHSATYRIGMRVDNVV